MWHISQISNKTKLRIKQFGVAILKCLLFGQLMAKKLPKGGNHDGFFGHEMAKKQNLKNRYTKFLECHRESASNFQVPSTFAVQMNVPFVIC